jgi:hypothetical protein
MLELLIEYYDSLKDIGLYLLVILIIYLFLIKSKFKKYILDNRAIYEKNPLMLPIISFFEDDDSFSIFKAFFKLIWIICKQTFESLMKPFYMALDGFIQVFKSFTVVVNNIRKQISAMRTYMFRIFEDMYRRIEMSLGVMTYLFLKIREIMKRVYGMSQLMLYTVQHSIKFLEAIISSSIGNFGKLADSMGLGLSIFTFPVGMGTGMWTDSALCFDPYTPILKDDYKVIYIKDIDIGQNIIDKNGKLHNVIVKMELDGRNTTMYNLNGIYVTGDHSVEFNKKTIRVKDHPSAKIISNYECSYLVCLITDTGYIPMINNTLFRDYLDTHNFQKHRAVNKMIDNYLNNDLSGDEYNNSSDIFSGIILNDIDIINKKDIIGYIEIAPWTLNMYKFRNSTDNARYSANILVEYNGKWIRMIEHPDAVYVELNKEILKQWVSKDNILELSNGIKIRDFVEINDKNVIDKMNEYLLS